MVSDPWRGIRYRNIHAIESNARLRHSNWMMSPKRKDEPSAPLAPLRSAPGRTSPKLPFDVFLREFVVTMPTRYREHFDEVAIREHAAIAHRRAEAPAHIELWRELPFGGVAICIVARDRSGLLSLISAALVVHEMDVVAAQAYCRPQADGGVEAVDIFWLRRVDASANAAPITRGEIDGISHVLMSLVDGTMSLDSVSRSARAIRAQALSPMARVRFEEGANEGLAVLTVEAFDRPGLLLAITQALYRQRIQIVWSEARTRDGRVLDHFHVAEFDGAAVRKERRGPIQTAVFAAIESLPK